ncbi:FkbM family methyltransferase [Chryseosolibacter indicus]|uniref:FkbM family methyltransferase n=1 Tax=Chryseosolibacter indicus TaxID=2782351 RepID=A0ABS5VPW3_9BACT|nr:FkbM family methyltransferase [Chryseosolibacter indicus]MBT1702832.1 FkbM family methyltransferase [Chryseosolibacter indicus]
MKATLKRILNTTLKPINFKISQAGVVIPVSGGIGYTNLVLGSEKWFNDLLNKLSMLEDFKDGLFVDVGTNIGQTLIKLKRVNANFRYIGFEPNPYCFHYLTTLIEANRWENCFVIPAALSDKNALLKLIIGNKIDAEGSIIAGLRPGKKKDKEVMINASVFDHLISTEEIKDLKIVKIDVEGAELNVLEGMRKTINMLRPVIVCEVLHAHSKNELEIIHTRNENIEALLNSMRYNIYRICKSISNDEVRNLQRIEHFDNRVYDKSSAQLCDYMFIPEERDVIVGTLGQRKSNWDVNGIQFKSEHIDILGTEPVIMII